MQPEEVKKLIEEGIAGVEAHVTGDGSHFEATVVGEVFAGQSPVNKQRMVYGTLTEQITSGALHAITIKAYSPDEWEKAQKLQISS